MQSPHKGEGISVTLFRCPRYCSGSRSQGGFTLIELLVAISIMLIIGAIAAPNFLSTSPRYHLKRSSRELVSNIRKARSLAIKFNRDVSIVFDTANKRYSVGGENAVNLATSVSFGNGLATAAAVGTGSPPSSGVSFSDNTLTFNSRGFASSTGAVYLENTKDDAYAVVVTTAGNISLRQWRGEWK